MNIITMLINEMKKQRSFKTDPREIRRKKEKMKGRMSSTGGWWGESRRWWKGSGFSKSVNKHLNIERELSGK